MSSNPYAPENFPGRAGVEPQRAGMRGGIVAIIAVGAGLLGLICGGVVGGVFGYTAGLAASFAQGPEGVTMVVTSPPRAKVGETIKITVTLTNTSADPVGLATIDIAGSFGDGLDLVSVDPAPATSDFDVDVNMTEHAFDPALPVGKVTVVTFTFKAVKAGTYTGDWDAWYTTSGMHTQTRTITIDP